MGLKLIQSPPKRVTWGEHKTGPNNRKVREIIRYKFEDLVERKTNGYVFKKKNKILISPSTLNHTVSKVSMVKIPDFILETRREIGSNIMENLEYMFKNKIYDTSMLNTNERDRKMINYLVDWLMENKIKVLSVEKFITNGVFCGFVDMIVSWNGVVCALELKCRNKHEVRFTDMVQSIIYSKLLGCQTYVVMLDDNGKVSFFRAPLTRRLEFYNDVETFLKFWKRFGVLETDKIERIDLNEEKYKVEEEQPIETVEESDNGVVWD